MKYIVLLLSVTILLPTTGCIFPGHRDEWDDHHHGDDRGHEEYREHSGYRHQAQPEVDATAERLAALDRFA